MRRCSRAAILMTLALMMLMPACRGKEGPVGASGTPVTVYVVPSTTPVVYVSNFVGAIGGGYSDGIAGGALFSVLAGLAMHSSGDFYVADTANSRIRKVTPAGAVTTLAGSGTSTFADGTGSGASFNRPFGVAVDTSGNVYVADTDNHRIRKITPAGVVTTLAGSGTPTWANGTGIAASFYSPRGVAVDTAGNVYVADSSNHRIRKITPAGVVTTLAGSGTAAFADGTGSGASFSSPSAIAIDASGNLFVTDTFNYRVRKVTPGGVVTTIAGSGSSDYADGMGTAASFAAAYGIALAPSGDLYVADSFNNRIRKIAPSGMVTTLAGSGFGGYADGIGISASFYQPYGIVMDPEGNLLVGDRFNNCVRKIYFF